MKSFIRVVLAAIIMMACAGQVFAQKDSTLSQKISKEFCDEFSKKEFEKFKDAEMELGLLILPIINKYSKEIETEWGLSASNLNDYEKIGEKIGMEAALTCPKFMKFIANNLDEIGPEDEEEVKSLSGNLISVEEQQFTCFIVKTQSGKEEKLWWFGYFEGADAFLEKKENFMNKPVEASYVEMEIYDPRLKDYRYIKVIKKLSKG